MPGVLLLIGCSGSVTRHQENSRGGSFLLACVACGSAFCNLTMAACVSADTKEHAEEEIARLSKRLHKLKYFEQHGG